MTERATETDFPPDRYFAACRQRIPVFVESNYGWPGAVALNRLAWGIDVLVAPINFLMGFPNFLLRVLALLLELMRARRAARWLLRRHLGFRTKVQEALTRRIAEWGLAGNAAFIAAPRARTRGLDLGGRAFLHDYDWHADAGFTTLELIMTAPMVVASWINLQYYGSTVDNRRFGSGNKVLHNVVGGAIGVLEGNAGDLRTGLPMQSLHDGHRWVHEPLRLSVVLQAPKRRSRRSSPATT